MSLIKHNVSGDGGVHTITLADPPGNVIGMALCEELRPALSSAAADERGKVLVLRAEGKHFSFGASVEEHLPEHAPAMLAAIGGVIRDLLGFPYPTLAVVQGRCLGGGLELALGCGIIIAADDAVLASPEIRLGVLPPAATAILTGRGAEDVLLTGRDLTAAEAHHKGIIDVLAPADALDETAAGFVEEHFGNRSPASLRLATRAIRGPQRDAIEARLAEAERLYREELLALHDGVEGIRAFIEKREPEWRNA